jgi:hypothetical protein
MGGNEAAGLISHVNFTGWFHDNGVTKVGAIVGNGTGWHYVIISGNRNGVTGKSWGQQDRW